MTWVTIKKTSIKYLPLIIIYLGLVSFGLYGTAIRQKKLYDEYNGMRGTVLSYTVNHSGDHICYIRLDNGVQDIINNGCIKVNVGDTWINHVYHWDPLFGLYGFSSFYVPTQNRCFFEHLINVICILLVVAILLIAEVCVLIYRWIKAH